MDIQDAADTAQGRGVRGGGFPEEARQCGLGLKTMGKEPVGGHGLCEMPRVETASNGFLLQYTEDHVLSLGSEVKCRD